MKTAHILFRVSLFLVPCVLPAPAPADTPAPPPSSAPASAPAPVPSSSSTSMAAGCAAANLRIVGPRTKDRPLPLLSGDGAHGFRPACAVSWTDLSPTQQPVAVAACYRDNLLQIANDHVCGGAKGKLWVSARWVLTSDAPVAEDAKVVVCQQLETGAYAATRSLKPSCVPGKPTPAASAASH